MTTVVAVAAALAVSFALCSLMKQVDGMTLRRWRLSRRWDVPRLAREFIAAADEPLASLRGLTHMINAWERGARRPSERYWLLYLRIFPECLNREIANGGPEEAGVLPGIAGASPVEAAALEPEDGADGGDVRTLAATVRVLELQIAGLTRRLDEISRRDHREKQSRERTERGNGKSGAWRWNWLPLWTVLLPSL